MFSLTLVDLENKTSVSILEFEMIVLKLLFCLHFRWLHD